MSQIAARSSLLFNRTRQVLARRTKSTFQYDADKTFSQRWVETKVGQLKQKQKLLAADDGLPLWWKTGSDRAIVTTVFAATIASFVLSLGNLYKYATGSL